MSVVREGPDPVLELRVALTTDDYERLSYFYRELEWQEPAAAWRVVIVHGQPSPAEPAPPGPTAPRARPKGGIHAR